jgi:hypothetical protein
LQATAGIGAPNALPPFDSAAAWGARAPNYERIEEEIARITWAVLDGRASWRDRVQLAELVNAQHARRHASA